LRKLKKERKVGQTFRVLNFHLNLFRNCCVFTYLLTTSTTSCDFALGFTFGH